MKPEDALTAAPVFMKEDSGIVRNDGGGTHQREDSRASCAYNYENIGTASEKDDESDVVLSSTTEAAALQSPRSVFEGPGADAAQGITSCTQSRKKTTIANLNSLQKTRLPKKNKKCVSWGTVQVSRHAILPGDHPDVTNGGPPLSIAWTALSQRNVPLDQFEWERQPHRAHSSHAHRELVLSGEFRHELLRRNGATDVDILHSLLQSERARWQRSETVRELNFFGWQEFTENLRRLFQLPQPALQTKY